MSDIPYHFTAIPNYLIDAGWIDDPKTCVLLVHLFSRIRYEPHIEVINHREIHLDAFEFIFGRDSISQLTGLTHDEVRLRMAHFATSKMLSKIPSKTTSKYTVYKWVKEHFCKNNPHQNPHQNPQQNPQHIPQHPASKGPTKKIEDKKQKTPPPNPLKGEDAASPLEGEEKRKGKRKEAFRYEGEISPEAWSLYRGSMKALTTVSVDKIQSWIIDYGLDAVRSMMDETARKVFHGQSIGKPESYIGRCLANNHRKLRQEKILNIREAYE